MGHFKTKHRDISIYSSEQLTNARKRRQVSAQPSIDSKFAKIEKSTGVELAVQLMRKLPGTPLSHFDCPEFLRPWGDVLAAVCATEAGCERIFSKRFVHNELRNRLSHEVGVALMRNSMIAEGFDGILNGEWI